MKSYIIVGLIIAILLFILYFFIKPYINIGIQNINISKEKWREDIIFLRDRLPQKHPYIYTFISQEDYMNEFDNLVKDIDGLEPYQILVRLQMIISKVNDPHTLIDYTLYESLPLELYYFDEGLYISGADLEHKELIGAKILSIGDEEINSVIKKAGSVCPQINESCLKYYIALNLTNPYVLEYFNIMKDKTVKFTLEKKNGEVIHKEIPIKRINEIKLAYTSDLIAKRPYYLTSNNREWFALLEDNHVLYYQNNALINNTAEEDVIKILSENGVDKFVIDLRKNIGGIYANRSKFVSMIGKLQEKNDLKLYILTGRATFSSAILYIHDFVDNTNCVLVGEPPRTGFNHYGDQRYFRLPNSKITVKYSSRFFNISDSVSDVIIPDISIGNRFADYAEGVDPALDYVLSD